MQSVQSVIRYTSPSGRIGYLGGYGLVDTPREARKYILPAAAEVARQRMAEGLAIALGIQLDEALMRYEVTTVIEVGPEPREVAS